MRGARETCVVVPTEIGLALSAPTRGRQLYLLKVRARVVIVVALLSVAIPAAASAHANLVRTEPANGAVLARPPGQVRVVFDDNVRPGPGIEAIRNGGRSIAARRGPVAGGGAPLAAP